MIVPYIEVPFFALFLLSIFFSLYAQMKVSTTFSKYSRISSGSSRTAAEVAKMILSSHGIYDVKIERVRGNLTDHFDPRTRTLRLSDSVYSSNSAAAIGVAAHEAGHAIQHEVGYFPIVLRSKLVPMTTFASRMAWPVILLGVIISAFGAVAVAELGYYVVLGGIALFSVAAIFQLVTLPCEFNASRRALADIRASGWYTDEELGAARKVLSAAALTYVAALFATIVQIIRLLMIFGRKRRQ